MSVEDVLLNPKESKVKELNRLIINQEIELDYIEDFIFRSLDSRLIYLCGKHIEWLNKGRVAHALSNTLDDYYILKYAYFIQNLDIAKSEKEKILCELAKGILRSDGTHNVYYYARDILNAPVDKLALKISKSSDSTYIYYMLRDLRDKLSKDCKEKLEKRILEISDPKYIVFTAKIASVLSINEFANCLLNTKRNALFGLYLSIFISDCEIQDKSLRSKLIEALIKTRDYPRIINLMKNSDGLPYMDIIDYILEENNNYKNPDFWLSYIIPIALCNNKCASYAVDKIIENNNIEIITIAIYYIENETLRKRLQNALNKRADIDYTKSKLSNEVISKVRELIK